MSRSSLRQASIPLLAAGVSLAAFTSCSNRPDPDLPFDRNGNYVEAWDKDGTYAYQEPEAPDFYEAEGTTTKKTTKKTTSSAKPKKKSPPSKPARKITPSYRTHTVKKGETLWSLSQKYNTSVSKIQKINGIRGTVIRIGQKIKVPR